MYENTNHFFLDRLQILILQVKCTLNKYKVLKNFVLLLHWFSLCLYHQEEKEEESQQT